MSHGVPNLQMHDSSSWRALERGYLWPSHNSCPVTRHQEMWQTEAMIYTRNRCKYRRRLKQESSMSTYMWDPPWFFFHSDENTRDIYHFILLHSNRRRLVSFSDLNHGNVIIAIFHHLKCNITIWPLQFLMCSQVIHCWIMHMFSGEKISLLGPLFIQSSLFSIWCAVRPGCNDVSGMRVLLVVGWQSCLLWKSKGYVSTAFHVYLLSNEECVWLTAPNE